MSIYLIVWGVICLLGFKDNLFTTTYSTRRYEFKVLFVVLLLILILRFGQGTDYFAYRYIYNMLSPTRLDLSRYERLHGEIGYLLICNLFRIAKAPFEVFVAFTAIFEMVCFYRFAKVFQIDTPFTWVLAYPTLYLTYFFSAIRQGITTAIFLGILLPLLLEKKYRRYILVTLFCVSIHSASIVFLLAIFMAKIKKVSTIQYCCIGAWLAGFILTTAPARTLIMSLGISSINYYLYAGTDVSILSVAERIFFIAIISMLYELICKRKKMNDTYRTLFLCYLLAMSLYGVFVGYSLISSRLGGVMRFVELYLLVYGIKLMELRTKAFVVTFFIVLETFMLTKNINAYITEGNYKDSITVTLYPYVSVFNEDMIYKVKNVQQVYMLK